MHVSQVREHGEFAIRGSIIDLFPMGSKTPFRIDLFDDEVDSIRIFSPDTQRSLEKIAEIRLLPAKEFPLTEEAIEHFRQTWRSQFSGNPLKSPIYQDISEGICAPGIEYYLPFFFEKTATFLIIYPTNTLIVTIGDMQAKQMNFGKKLQCVMNKVAMIFHDLYSHRNNYLFPLDILNQSLDINIADIQINQMHSKENDFDICHHTRTHLGY